MTGPAAGPPPGEQKRGAPAAGDQADGEQGTAVVEFCSLGLLLMLPLIYLVVAMGRIEAASFAADGSAREAASPPSGSSAITTQR